LLVESEPERCSERERARERERERERKENNPSRQYERATGWYADD
jgi:hypothetical protein